jgi:hypothetical protein
LFRRTNLALTDLPTASCGLWENLVVDRIDRGPSVEPLLGVRHQALASNEARFAKSVFRQGLVDRQAEISFWSLLSLAERTEQC